MTPYEQFKLECSREIAELRADRELATATRAWMDRANARKYSYHFEYLGRPIIQYPQDIVALQELVWNVRPDLIFETGIAHGGSLILSASMLALLDMSEAIEAGEGPSTQRRPTGVFSRSISTSEPTTAQPSRLIRCPTGST